MRNTARPQVIALALIGALAWIAFDGLNVRAAVADYFRPAALERPDIAAPAPTASVDERPAGEERPAPKVELIPVKSLHTPEGPVPSVWILETTPQMVVG